MAGVASEAAETHKLLSNGPKCPRSGVGWSCISLALETFSNCNWGKEASRLASHLAISPVPETRGGTKYIHDQFSPYMELLSCPLPNLPSWQTFKADQLSPWSGPLPEPSWQGSSCPHDSMCVCHLNYALDVIIIKLKILI